MKNLFLLFTFFLSFQLFAQSSHSHAHGREIVFPNVPGYETLKCDFHQHTVFSDGSVWPDIRIQEAMKDGLDAVSMTDHLEYQPHRDDIPHPDRNRSYEVALKSAKNKDLIVVNGSEITREMPPGHSNAIFIEDANALMDDNPMKVFREANRQGAFVFWNHPHWTAQKPDGIAELDEMHEKLIRKGHLHGIEVVNDVTYSDEALQIALDNDLTIMGTSDIHGLVDWQYKIPEGGHRPVTLVFAKEKSAESIKEALKNRQTVVWFNNLLIGRSEQLTPLLKASIVVNSASYKGNTSVVSVSIENLSDANYILANHSQFSLHAHADIVSIPAHETTVLDIKTLERLDSFELEFEVLNAVTAPKEHPMIQLSVKVE
ncbi:MAG: PHP domain-containing protein [Bacteroidetes bacterium]|nr:PHP domain-containing protein [Bacteroidota bacterium]